MRNFSSVGFVSHLVEHSSDRYLTFQFSCVRHSNSMETTVTDAVKTEFSNSHRMFFFLIIGVGLKIGMES